MIHLSQRVLGVRVAARRCQFQPPRRVLVILNHARALAQRIAKLVLGIGAAVLGRTFQPLLRVPLVAFHSVPGRIQVGKLVFGDGVIALGAFDRVRNTLDRRSCALRCAAGIFGHVPEVPHESSQDRGDRGQTDEVTGASTDDPETRAAITAAIGGTKPRRRGGFGRAH